jgi:transposase
MLILAIDLGQSKSVFCNFETTTGEVEFGRVATSRAALQKVLEQKRPERVVIEISPLAGWVYDLVQSLKIEIQVADPTQDAWRWKNVKRKTDEDDALKLARLSALDQLNLVHIPSPPRRQWRRLIQERVTLVAEQTRCKNRIRALLLAQEQTGPAGKNGWTKKALERLEQLGRPLSECSGEELWRGILHTEVQRLRQTAALLKTVEDKLDELAAGDANAQLLQSIPGVGPRTAEVVRTALDDPHRFRSGRQVAAYAGLTPRRWQSGSMARQGRISKRGSRTLRQALNQAAWMAVRYNPWARAVFTRIKAGKKERAKIAIVAVMRKLLVVAWAMLRDQKRYRRPALVTETLAA